MPVPDAAPAPSMTAERVWAAARPKLLQIRTLVAAAGRQSTIGSGFLVSADGLAITNYHVVSQFALEQSTYRLEYTMADGSRGDLDLLAIDLANDLAVVRLKGRGSDPFFGFDERALRNELSNGERFYSMGNPLNLGFTIVEGTHNGWVERTYNKRLHFSGAINPGMSGGPTVNADGRVIGINVAKMLSGDLLSFLVPVQMAADLLAQAGRTPPEDFRPEIGRQLARWQAGLYHDLDAAGFRTSAFGPYQAPESTAPWFTCWARTNTGQVPKPRAAVSTTNCTSETRLFVANDLSTGVVSVTHAFASSFDLNSFQFAAFLSQQNQLTWAGAWSRKWLTPKRCHEDFVRAGAADGQPALRVAWCARAYRDFEGLYDISVMAVTQDSGSHALLSRLHLQATGYDHGMAMGKRFLEAIQWKK
ncbi:MAG: trypsin-like peptidase domain-containing protein [Alphaproteobacteria bacterium]|nr:trypsin-like peptidase domain-containing protein [Alphaproteobacteria bacterium]